MKHATVINRGIKYTNTMHLRSTNVLTFFYYLLNFKCYIEIF